MPKLLYLANIRLPTEKAHGLQIMQNCEAFTDAGAEVRLWVARRVNTAEMAAVKDVWAHYGVQPKFSDGHSTGIYTWDYLYQLGARQAALWQSYLDRLEAAQVQRDTPMPAKGGGCGSH